MIRNQIALFSVMVALGCAIAMSWRTYHGQSERKSAAQSQKALWDLSQAELRERFKAIPERLKREMFEPPNGSLIVGIQLLDSELHLPPEKRGRNPIVAKLDGPFDIVSVKPLEDIGCGCCTNDVICESFGEADFRLLSMLTGVRKLEVSNTHITDKCPLMLRSHDQLEVLDLSKNPLLTDRVIDRLRHLQTLRSIDLSDTAIKGEGLSKLAAMPHLERLVLAGTQVTDDALWELSSLKRLKELDLSRTPITGSGFARLDSLPALEVLNLAESQLTSDGLARLPVMPALRVLRMFETKLTDRRINVLSQCSQLEEVNFYSTSVGDATFASLAPLVNLKSVQAYGTLVTDAGLQSLRGKRQLQYLDVSHTQVQGPGLRHLADCLELQSLNATRDMNSPALVDAETAETLGGLSKLVALDVHLAPTESSPIPSLHLSNLPLLRRLTISCPAKTGTIELTGLPSLTHLRIRGVLKPVDGYLRDDTPLPRPLPQIEAIRLVGVGPSETQLRATLHSNTSFRYTVLDASFVVPKNCTWKMFQDSLVCV